MKTLTLVVRLAVFLGGCGSAGSGSTANNVTMQGGQWEYAVVPANDVIPFFIEVNLPTTNSSFSMSPSSVFWNLSENGFVNMSAPSDCFNLDLKLNASISGTTLKGEFGQPTFANFSGEMATNGLSITTGTYSGGFCSDSGLYGAKIKGTLTGSTIAPVNGTFTGTLNSNLHGPAVVTLTITQDADFTLNFTGTLVENGVTTKLVPGATARANYVIGAFVTVSGSAVNINGSEMFTFTAHSNANATQMTGGFGLGNLGAAEFETVNGSLTKQ
jgi:hypothetical protein